jgi:aromatase
VTTVDAHRTEASATIAAPAPDVYRLLTDVAEWPLLYPWIAHTEILESDVLESGGSRDLVKFWAVKPDGTARIWTSRRTLDPRALRMDFEQLGSVGPITGLGGTWVFHPDGEAGCRVETTHWFTTGHDPAEVAGELDRNSARQLAVLRAKAERREEFAGRVLRVERRRELPYTVEESYDLLVRSLGAEHDGAAFVDLASRAPAGGTRTGRTLRIAVPGRAVVQQDLEPADPLELWLRRWRVEQRAGGTLLTAAAVLSSPQAARPRTRELLRAWADSDLAASLAAVER